MELQNTVKHKTIEIVLKAPKDASFQEGDLNNKL